MPDPLLPLESSCSQPPPLIGNDFVCSIQCILYRFSKHPCNPRSPDPAGVLWQEVPPLRPSTGASLGCLWGRAAAASGRSMIDTCVLAVGPGGGPGSALEEGRRRMALLGRLLASATSQVGAGVGAGLAVWRALRTQTRVRNGYAAMP